MSRSGYVDDWEDRDQGSMPFLKEMARWRGAVESAINSHRGQAFLKEMLAALDAMPEKKLIAAELEAKGQVCALGAVGKARGIDMKELDPYDRESVADLFGIASAMVAEIFFLNDERRSYSETQEERFYRMRRWVQRKIVS